MRRELETVPFDLRVILDDVLSLFSRKTRDEGLGFLATSCSKLSHLTLVSTRMTDDGLSNLASCSMLRSLEIYHCTGVQGPGLAIIAFSCKKIRYMVISHRFEGMPVLEQLKKHCCLVRLEDDDDPI